MEIEELGFQGLESDQTTPIPKIWCILNLIEYQTDVKRIILKKYFSDFLKYVTDKWLNMIKPYINIYPNNHGVQFDKPYYEYNFHIDMYYNMNTGFTLYASGHVYTDDDSIVQAILDLEIRKTAYSSSERSTKLYRRSNLEGIKTVRQYYYIADLEDNYNTYIKFSK